MSVAAHLSFPLSRRGSRGSHAPDLDDSLFVLGAVEVHFAAVVNNVASGGHRHGVVGFELLAGANPPGAGQRLERLERYLSLRVLAGQLGSESFQSFLLPL